MDDMVIIDKTKFNQMHDTISAYYMWYIPVNT